MALIAPVIVPTSTMLRIAALGAAASASISKPCRAAHGQFAFPARHFSSTDQHEAHESLTHDQHDPRNTTVSLNHPIFTVWGANTGVGKTLVSAGLAAAFARQQVQSPDGRCIP